MRIGYIGGGVMAEAMIRGLLDKDMIKPKDVVVSDISRERRDILGTSYGISVVADNRSAVQKAEVVVMAVKPNVLVRVMGDLKGGLRSEQMVLSIVAGASISTISKGLDHKAVVRAMPNTPAQIGEGISVWTAAGEVDEAKRKQAGSILAALGTEIYMSEEKYVDMATAVSGSGPAYIFLVIESLIDAAVHIGLPRDVATDLVLQTSSGASHLAQKSDKHPAELRNMVTSPGGTTAEGLLRLEEGGLRALFTQAVSASYEKAKALGRDS